MPESSNQITVPSFAKINLSLRVLGRRADALHEVRTVLQTVSLHDTLTFETLKNRRLEIFCDEPSIPTDGRNLIHKAAMLLAERYGVNAGARVRLVKRTPSGGGLGGGSSNAGVTLLALAKMWKLDVTASELSELAARLGADVPFFLYGGTALGTGTGTRIAPLTDAAPLSHLLIVTPPIAVSTALAYAALAAPPLAADTSESSPSPSLTNDSSPPIFTGSHTTGSFISARDFDLHNDFEPPVFRLFPETGAARDLLMRCGARAALLSGSGASVFGVFDEAADAGRALGEMSAAEEAGGFRFFECATVNRESYRAALSSVAIDGDG